MDINPVLVWFLAGLVLILAEFMLPGVIIVFFGVGAWITMLTTWLGLTPGLTSQLLTFGISSVLLLLVLRRRLQARLHGHESGSQDPALNIDDEAGTVVTVTTPIVPGSDTGRVEYKGASWRARGDQPIASGQRAVILETDGITLVVKPGE